MNIEIANKLVKLRKKHNLSQEELANKLGLSRQAISKWERAESSPDTDNLISLAKLYNISLDELLLTNEDDNNINKNRVIIISKRNKNFWALFPYPLFITILFFILSYAFEGWGYSWILFITIPVYYSLVCAIRRKNLYHFNYPVFIVCVYLFINFTWDLWGISWILFISIPLYYGIISAYKKSRY